MGIKSIFKALVGTIVIIVVASLVIEVFNISTTSLQLNQISKMAGRQAAVLFTQESYKQMGDDGAIGGSVNMNNVISADGGVYVSGQFYNSNDATSIYNQLYTSDNFKNWMKNEPAVAKGNWYNLNLINRALNNPASLNMSFGQPGYDDAMTSKLYKEVMMTPSNLGIPYLDKDVMVKMFQWNLAQLLSNCKQQSILRDESGRNYVSFRGFRVYADLATISNIEYKTFDLTDLIDRQEFSRLTKIDPDGLGFGMDQNLKDTIKATEDERTRVCIVGISYNVPMTYDGLTPIKRIFNYVWNTEVDGLNNGRGRQSYQQWNDSLTNLRSGGLNGNPVAEGVLPVPGRLIYYITR